MNPEHPALYKGTPRKYALLIGAVCALCVLAAAYALCTSMYRERRTAILAEEERYLGTWVHSTAASIDLWTEGLKEQVGRVSRSETYSMFTADVLVQGEQAAANINAADSGGAGSLPSGMDLLVEQLPYMRNLLLDFMNFNGFTDARILSPQGGIILSALARPTPITPEQQEAARACITSGKIAFAPVRPTSGGLLLDMADPLLADSGESKAPTPVGALLITTPVAAPLAGFLTREIQKDDTVTAGIVQKHGAQWEVLQAGSARPEPAAISDLQDTGLPFALRTDATGKTPVYSCAVKVKGMDWWVLLERPAAAIDAKLKGEFITIYALGGLASLGVLLVLLLIRRIVVGREQRALARQFEALYRQIRQQKRLLDSLNNSLEVGLVMTDPNGRISVCNPAFAGLAHAKDSDLTGTSLAAIFDPKTTAALLEAVRAVMDSGKSSVIEISTKERHTEQWRLFRVTLFPLEDTEDDADLTGAVAIFQDITEFRRRSKQHARQQSNTIAALVQAIEGVDPYLAGHSQLMQLLGTVLGAQMGLDKDAQRCLDTATSLSQVGRLFVPRELLTKSGKLTPEEQAELARIPEYAHSILRYIDFGLPVTEAIYEMYEKMDGSGYPRHLKGEEISLHARILAVLNAFCAMVSPRSYRAAMPIEQALDLLRSQQNVFDQQIVNMLAAALFAKEGREIMAYRNMGTPADPQTREESGAQTPAPPAAEMTDVAATPETTAAAERPEAAEPTQPSTGTPESRG